MDGLGHDFTVTGSTLVRTPRSPAQPPRTIADRTVRSKLRREIERSTRSNRPLSCCFIDLDRFKHINHSYGHPHGSQVLADVALLLRNGIRIGDTLGRYGGDEFVAILPDTDQGAALVLAERLRSTISTTTLNGAHEPLGASVGVAQSRPGCTAEDLLAAADEALRRAKRAGGGLVVGASDVAAGAGRGVACRDQRRQHLATPATPLGP